MREIKYNFLEPILLSEMEQVKLMNRTDKKYWFNASLLQELLWEIKDDYYMLNVDSVGLLPYETVYYDTPESKMYRAHHNGKLNRFKVRRRSYLTSGISFFEIKMKNNKGRTIKKRIPSEFSSSDISIQEKAFLNEFMPFFKDELKPLLTNNFSRITLVNKNFKERCTIDLGLRFKAKSNHVKLDDLVIVEVKSEGRTGRSPIQYALRSQHIKPSGFSKYCIGRTLTDNGIKRNGFKPKVRSIEKIINTGSKLYN